jgi:tetratricopeptide (TPR) repeat protein
MAVKKPEINYTPEELAEIDRIIKVITESEIAPVQEMKPVTPVKPQAEEEDFSTHEIEDLESEMPTDLDIDFDSEISEEPDEYDTEADFEREKIKDKKPSGKTVFETEEEDLEEIEDISDIITEAEKMPSEEAEEVITLSDSDLSFVEEEGPESEKLEIEEIPEVTEDLTEAVPPVKDRKTADTFSLEKEEDFDLPDLNEIPVSETADIPEAETADIPEIDLSDLEEKKPPAGEYQEIESIEEIPESFDEEPVTRGKPEEKETSTFDEMDSFTDEFSDIEEPVDVLEEKPAPPKKETKPEKHVDDLIKDTHEDDVLTIEPLDDDIIDHVGMEETPPISETKGEASPEMELSDRDLARLKKAIILFNPGVRQAIKDVVINELLPASETRKLVDMIITGKSEDSIHRFLEKKLKRKIDLIDEVSPRRRVLTARPEYTLEGRERQKKLFKFTSIFAVSAIVAFILTIISYQFIYKPYMAKKLIREGVSLIVKSSLKGERFDRLGNYKKAEEIFKEVDEEYIKDYLFGYNEYARAYLKNGDYEESLGKLNKAYTIDKTHIDTLNNLGYFYAKTTPEYFERIKPKIQEWYFKDKKDLRTINTPLDLAIMFYRRALLIDKDNINSLLGIGNAYFYQGQYLNAKKYYEDILRADPKSPVGYSGLLNLYIERDSYPLVATIHAELRDKKMLKELPSPLLSKLAGYYLDKRAKGDSNVRIDYGVTTPKLKDSNDNTYPAVLEVLKAINDRDPNYPQLHIQFARLHMAQQNMAEMERYLDKALSLAPNYYSALHLKGEYHYNIKEPVKAYKYLNDALKSIGEQPDFTKDEFYKETESPGKTNMYLGNIFYYYFDKVKSRSGGLEDEIIKNEKEVMDNYEFAQKYYIEALNYYTKNNIINFKASELYYNLGRIHYLKGEYSLALNSWLHLYDDFVKSPELMLSLGNAFYNSGNGAGPGNYEAAKGEYLKLISVLEYEAEKIKVVDLSKVSHVKIFQTLSSAYNNLGAVYQNTGEHTKRDIAYWKAIDYGQKMNQENEYARVNLARSNRDADPLLDKWIPFSIDIYREDMRN